MKMLAKAVVSCESSTVGGATFQFSHVVVGRLMAPRWPLAGGSPHFCARALCTGQPTAWQLALSERDVDIPALCNLISGVTSHYFC